MDKIAEVLLYFLPAVVVLFAVFMLIKKFLDNAYKIRLIEARQALQKDVIPLRFQAYERICLFLERISPNNLLPRAHRTGISARELHTDLLMAIRAEFEHNLSQQIYMSSEAWEEVRKAREGVVRIINIAFTRVGEHGTGIELSKTIFEVMLNNDHNPAEKALEALKREVRKLL